MCYQFHDWDPWKWVDVQYISLNWGLNPIHSTYAAAALLRRLVHQYCKRHPITVLKLLPHQALRQLRQADQAAVGHLLVHLDGRHAWFSEAEEKEKSWIHIIKHFTLGRDFRVVMWISPESQPWKFLNSHVLGRRWRGEYFGPSRRRSSLLWGWRWTQGIVSLCVAL